MTSRQNGSALKRVLVATDFSRRAEMALRRAAQIAGEQAATLSLLHVTDSDNLETRSSTEGAEEKLRQHIANYLPNEAAGSVRVVAGKPFVEIIRGARKEAADLVVLGAHGEHFLKDLLFGTTAEKVVRKGDRPVLIVKRPPHGPYPSGLGGGGLLGEFPLRAQTRVTFGAKGAIPGCARLPGL